MGHHIQILRHRERPRQAMRTIFVRVTAEASPSYAPVLATPITSTSFSIESAHPDFADAALEFGVGDRVRCKVIRLRGPGQSEARQRMIAVERIG
jgi:hypothetical protein